MTRRRLFDNFDFMPIARTKLNIQEADLWYAVGLITTDGCLSSDGRHIDITSAHREYLENVRLKMGLKCRVGIKLRRDAPGENFRIQFANKNFYEFLTNIGLTPKKSLTLGPLRIPESYYADFFRGVIDGDGNILNWVHPSNGVEQWSLRVYSAAPLFIAWLKSTAEASFCVKGKLHRDRNIFVLKFGKLAAKRVLSCCYAGSSLYLERKMKLAQRCIASTSGWSKSHTLVTI